MIDGYLVAIHEAGHAVAALLSGLEPDHVRIWQNSAGEWEGNIDYGEYDRTALHMVIVHLAGGVAVHSCLPGAAPNWAGCDHDIKLMNRVLRANGLTSDRVPHFVRETRKLLECHGVRVIIEKMAKELFYNRSMRKEELKMYVVKNTDKIIEVIAKVKIETPPVINNEEDVVELPDVRDPDFVAILNQRTAELITLMQTKSLAGAEMSPTEEYEPCVKAVRAQVLEKIGVKA